MINVVIIDDHPIVRAGMRAVLETADDIRVMGEGASGGEALRLAQAYAPQVLVLDVNLPDLNGLEVARQLKGRVPGMAILALTVQNDPQTIFGLLENGATGYVLKDEALETLVCAVRTAARGETWLSPAVASQVVRYALASRPAAGWQVDDRLKAAGLTAREVEVLSLLAQGLDNQAISRKLVLAGRTVQNHVSRIYAKLEVGSRTEAALTAIRWGLVRPEQNDV